VLIPLLFMGDIVGRLFREFAVTLSVTILVSAIVSLTLTPMMSAKLLRHTPPEEQGRFYRKSEEIFERVIDYYGRTLQVVLSHQRITLLVFAATFALTLVLFVIVPKGFFPIQDTGAIQAVSVAGQSVSFEQMKELQKKAADVVLKDPAVESLSSFIGVDQTNTTLNTGRLLINLKPLKERDASASEVIRRLQPELEKVAGITLYMQPVQDITVESQVSRTQFQYTLESPNTAELNEWAPKLLAELQKLPELRDVASDQQTQGLRTQLVFDRETASRLGITPSMIDQTLYDSYGQRQISTMYTQLNQYHVILEVQPEFQNHPGDLQSLFLRSSSNTSGSGLIAGTSTAAGRGISAVAPQTSLQSSNTNSANSSLLSPTIASSVLLPNGTQIPMSAFSRLEQTTAPIAISHQGQFPSVTLSFNLAPNASLGEAVKPVEHAQDSLHMPLSIQGQFQGTAAAFEGSLANEGWLILAALVTVYIVLGVLYESYIHPITILSTLPSAGVGALLFLIFTGTDFGIMSLIGLVLLIGIVKKNAIMMIDFALEAEREEGKPPEQSIYEACLLRFRPIMMTTMAALLGAVPLALGTGMGSELRHPLGISIIGGLLVSQLLTLYTTPVIYLWFDRIARHFATKRNEGPEPEPEMVPAD
jgi:multidrug efflux pump